MKLKYRFFAEVLLILVAAAVFVYNLLMHRNIAYMASVIAVCGTTAMLIKDIKKLKG